MSGGGQSRIACYIARLPESALYSRDSPAATSPLQARLAAKASSSAVGKPTGSHTASSGRKAATTIRAGASEQFGEPTASG